MVIGVERNIWLSAVLAQMDNSVNDGCDRAEGCVAQSA
jgi:hypothetical protein